MLASLLAKQPVNNQPIPPVPAHEITATPQEKLPRITDPNKNIQLAMAAQSNAMSNSRININRYIAISNFLLLHMNLIVF